MHPHDTPVQTKQCGICGERKPFADFPRNTKGIHGLHTYCTECKRAHGRAYAKARYIPRPRVTPLPGFKKCCTCKAVLPVSDFSANTSRPDGLQSQCITCKRASARKYWTDHPDKARDHYVKNRQTIIRRATVWAKENPIRRAGITAARNARIQATRVGKVDYEAILERDGYVCHICGGEVMPGDIHFDHVIPLSRGGPHVMDNIRVSHSVCNMRKGSSLPEEMRG